MRWSKDLTFTKDPTDVVDYILNFNALLQSDTISTVQVSGKGVNIDSYTVNGNIVTVFVSGGNACTVGKVTITMTTTNTPPRVFERSFDIKIEDL